MTILKNALVKAMKRSKIRAEFDQRFSGDISLLNIESMSAVKFNSLAECAETLGVKKIRADTTIEINGGKFAVTKRVTLVYYHSRRTFVIDEDAGIAKEFDGLMAAQRWCRTSRSLKTITDPRKTFMISARSPVSGREYKIICLERSKNEK